MFLSIYSPLQPIEQGYVSLAPSQIVTVGIFGFRFGCRIFAIATDFALGKSSYRISERIRYDLLHLKSIARWRCWTDKDESIAILVISLY